MTCSRETGSSSEETLPGWLREQVGYWQQRAANCDLELEAQNGELEALSAGKAIPKGLGSLTAALLGCEILDWHRFKNRRQLASYTGLCPSEYPSRNARHL